MIFGRKKKSAGNRASVHDEVDGIVRRGLAATIGRLPSEHLSSPRRVEGANPYDSVGRVAKRKPAAPKKSGQSMESAYRGAGNPYDNAKPAPGKRKRGSWDDAFVGISKGR